jgi:hypothetical protein
MLAEIKVATNFNSMSETFALHFVDKNSPPRST